MSSAEKIKRLFAKSDITVNSKVDDRIINDALTAFDKSEKTQSVSPEQNIWRLIMKNPITKLAAAAAITIAIILGIKGFNGTTAWAEVIKAINITAAAANFVILLLIIILHILGSAETDFVFSDLSNAVKALLIILSSIFELTVTSDLANNFFIFSAELIFISHYLRSTAICEFHTCIDP